MSEIRFYIRKTKSCIMNPYQNQMIDSRPEPLDIETESDTIRLNPNPTTNQNQNTNAANLIDKDCEKCLLECCLGVLCEVLCQVIFGGVAHSIHSHRHS